MQFPIIVGLRRSFILAGVAVVIHAAALLVVCLPEWTTTTTAACFGLIFISAGWSWRLWNSQNVVLRLLSDGRLECRFTTSDAFMPAELALATVHPLMTVIQVQMNGRKMAVVALPDSGRLEDLRQLRIWLRWRADFKPGGGREE